MLNTFKKFLRDGFSDSHTARRSRGRKRKSQVRNQTAIEALEAKTLLTATLQNYLTTEHVDLNLQHDGSEWAIGPRNSDQFPAIQYANDEAVMYVGAPAEITRPGSSDFDFVGVESGESLFYLPQSQDTELIFAGFAAYGLGSSVDSYNPVDESKGRVNGSTRWAKTTLTDVRHTSPDGTTGDGEFSLWQAGTFGQITVLMASYDDGQDNANSDGLDVTDGISGDDAMWIPAGGHNHFNFGFTEPGRYEVDVKLSAYFGDDGNNSTANGAGYSESDDITLYFSVMSVGELQFEQSSYSVNEDAGTASIDVVRTGGSDGRITVDYATSDGTATEPGDYTAASGTLEFLDGEIRKTITVPIIDDADEELDESFTVQLADQSPTNIDSYLEQHEGRTDGLLGTVNSATVTIIDNDAIVPFAITGIATSYQPGDIMQARLTGVALEDGQEIQWRIRPVGTDFTGTVLSRFVPETDNADARAGRLDMQLDASYDGYELVATVMQGEQSIATTEWAGPIVVSDAVETLSLTYSGPSPFRIGETATLIATGRELSEGESLKVVINASLDHYNVWREASGYHSLDERTFAFEPPSNTVYPMALQVIKDGLVVAQSDPLEVDIAPVEFLLEGLQPVYREGQTFSAMITVAPDLGDEVIYSWAMYDDYENPLKVATGEEGRTFEMPLTADMDGKRMFIQARLAYESGNTALIGGAYPYLTVVDDASGQLFVFSSLPDHYHQGAPVELELSADPELVEGDSVAWEWRWPSTEWETLPGAEGLDHQLTAEQAMDGLEVRATLNFANAQFDPMVAGPVTIEIDDHGAAPLQQPSIAGDLSVEVGDPVNLTRELPDNGGTILTSHLWERKAPGESSFSAIAGKTGSTLSFAATPADNGAEYRVSILKPNGTVAYGPSPAALLNAANGNPSISAINDVTLNENSNTTVSFTIGDAETAAGDLVVVATSANTAVVPDANLVLGGNGTNRTLTITPAADQSGSTTITVTVTDGGGLQATETFDVAVISGLVPFSMPIASGQGQSQQLKSADFTGDGIADVIAASGFAGSLIFLEGIGDGSFLSDVALNHGSDMYSGELAEFDFDGDGDLDIVAGEYDADTLNGLTMDGQLALYRNDGSGQFTREVLRGGLPQVADTTVADLNGDGFGDIVYSKDSTSLVLQTSNSAGELGAEVVLSSLSSIASMKMHDIDNDGDLDIVASDSGAESILIFTNDGSANFGAPVSLTPDETGTTLHQVVDLNGDGNAGLLVTDAGAPNKVGYYPQQAGGTFGARVNVPIHGQVVSSLSATDFNGDGVIDIGFTHTNYDDVAFTFFDFNVGWALGQGGGDFGPAIVVQRYDSIMYSMATPDLDGDGDPDIVVPQRSGPTSVAAFINQDGEDPMRFIAPESRTYTGGDPIELQVYFGLPITVTGTPRIALDLRGETVYAEYASGSGTATHQFVYQVGETDLDLDGVQLADNAIDLNGGTLTDPLGTSALLEFPDTVLDGVIVNAVGPLVEHISRGDSTPTDAASVRFTVEFAEAVEGVDASDFQVKMFDGDLAGAVIESVTGSGDTYEVTVSTGTGSGVLALSVNEDASVTDQEGAPLARGYVGGEVYTLRRGVEAPIDMYFTDGHGDYRPVLNDGELSYVLHGDSGVIPDGEVPSGEIYTYVDSTGIVNRAEDDSYDFLGVDANEPLYVIPSTQVPSLPFLGFSGEGVPNGALASYVPDHPNVTSSSASPYIKLEMVDVRSTSGGEFSLWSNPPSWNPGAGVSVYMATSDGVSDADALFLRVGSHGHFNVGFSEPGIYEVDIYASGYLDNDHNGVYDPGKDSYIESGIQTMVFAVDSLGAVDDSFTVLEGETLTGDVSTNDDWHEAMGDYTASVETEPAHGTLTLNVDGTFIYEPDAALAGVDSFVYRLTNERGGFTTATVTLLTHHTPTAVDDAFVVASGSSVYGNVLFNDFDVDGDALLAALDAGPTSGSVVVSADGSFVYTPSAAFDDSDSFTYSIDDGTGLTSTATVVISAAEDSEFEVVLTEGHVDIGVVIGEHDHDDDDDHDHDHDDDDHDDDHEEEAEWDLHVHDHEGEVEYHADEALLYVGMDAITDRPAGTAYDFIGTDAGESVFVLPATENSDLLFLGLGTEEIEVGTFLDGTLELRLKSVSGPGQFAMWKSGLEGPELAMATSDGITEADLVELLEGGHAHANFGFTEMGLYQITLQASGTLADGDVVVSEDVTYFFKVGNTAEGIEVQNGMTQRSHIDELDVLFGSEDGLDEILTNPDRVQITKYDLNGENGSLLSDAGYSLSANGSRLSFDFGVQGLGGNRNSNAGDGYYEVGIDADGDGEYETYQSFYRLLGDVNGDRKVDAADRMTVMQSMRNQNPEADVNGDGRVNSIDFALVSRALGRDLRDGLFDDDEDE